VQLKEHIFSKVGPTFGSGRLSTCLHDRVVGTMDNHGGSDVIARCG
jgi:hypothetical protein